MIEHNSEFKKLHTMLKKAIEQKNEAKALITSAQKDYKSKSERVQMLEKKIEQLTNSGEIIVTEHAILRYIERVKGVNVSEIKEEILSEDLIALITTLGGNGTYPVNNVKYLVKNNAIITVTT